MMLGIMAVNLNQYLVEIRQTNFFIVYGDNERVIMFWMMTSYNLRQLNVRRYINAAIGWS